MGGKLGTLTSWPNAPVKFVILDFPHPLARSKFVHTVRESDHMAIRRILEHSVFKAAGGRQGCVSGARYFGTFTSLLF